MDRWSLHILLTPLGLTKPSGCIICNSSLINPLRKAVLFIHLPDFINAAIANMIWTDLSIDTSEKLLIVVNTLNLSKTFCDNSSFLDSNTTINVRLPLEDPFNLNDLPNIGQ